MSTSVRKKTFTISVITTIVVIVLLRLSLLFATEIAQAFIPQKTSSQASVTDKKKQETKDSAILSSEKQESKSINDSQVVSDFSSNSSDKELLETQTQEKIKTQAQEITQRKPTGATLDSNELESKDRTEAKDNLQPETKNLRPNINSNINWKNFTNNKLPNLKIVYPETWKLTTNLTYQSPGLDYIYLERDGIRLALHMPRGIGGMFEKLCQVNNGKYQKSGQFVTVEQSGENAFSQPKPTKRILYMNPNDVVFREDNPTKFREVKTQIEQEINSHNQLNPDYPRKTVGSNDDVCILGSGILRIKSLAEADSYDQNILSELTIEIYKDNPQALKEAKAIISNSTFR